MRLDLSLLFLQVSQSVFGGAKINTARPSASLQPACPILHATHTKYSDARWKLSTSKLHKISEERKIVNKKC